LLSFNFAESVDDAVNEPHNWFRTSAKRAPTDLEAFNTGLLDKGKVAEYTCVILDRSCRYEPKTGAGDCRRCNFALVHLMENPGQWRERA
jgi:hypothetical protein